MNRVLITGGAGFIGSHLARRLDARGWQVTSIDNLSPQVHLDADASRRRLAGALIESDVSDDLAFARAGDADAVVHLAAETGVGQSMYEVERYREVNVEGTRRVAAWCAARGVPLVFFSSRAVYGEGRYACTEHPEVTDGSCCALARPVASREEDPLAPVSIYGETKVEGEQLLLTEAAGEVPLVIVRPQNVIGSGQALHNPYTGVLAAFLARLKEGRPIQVYGDGSATRDFIDVSDVARLVEAVLADPPSVGSPLVINCGSGARTTLVELASYAIAGAPVGGSIEHVEVHRAGDIEHACADLTRLIEAGLPSARVTVADAVAAFIRDGWSEPGAASAAWDDALDDLAERGLAT
ncbi:MAG TPA: NAD-dependent epimerase/dehydratase family protein [Acidimicrobiales bacterium]|nr:NAD-dependent epimerase/dehydratase family protein [Acidimicrobiales bacterium]